MKTIDLKVELQNELIMLLGLKSQAKTNQSSWINKLISTKDLAIGGNTCRKKSSFKRASLLTV